MYKKQRRCKMLIAVGCFFHFAWGVSSGIKHQVYLAPPSLRRRFGSCGVFSLLKTSKKCGSFEKKCRLLTMKKRSERRKIRYARIWKFTILMKGATEQFYMRSDNDFHSLFLGVTSS